MNLAAEEAAAMMLGYSTAIGMIYYLLLITKLVAIPRGREIFPMQF